MNNVVDDVEPGRAGPHAALVQRARPPSASSPTSTSPLVRFGAIVGSIRTPDPANGTDFIDRHGRRRSRRRSASRRRSSSTTDCAIPPTDPLSQQPKGRVSFGANGTYRVDRLPPPGIDPATGVSVASYLVRFHKDGFADQYRVVSAPSLNEERLLDVVMLPEPTQVRITPYWTNAEGGRTAGADRCDRHGLGHRRLHHVAAWPRCPGRHPAPLLGGTFDSKPTTFKSGSITVTVVAPGFAPASTTISLLVPGPTDPPNPDIVYEVHPGGTTILTARRGDESDAADGERQPRRQLLQHAGAVQPADLPGAGGLRRDAGPAAGRHAPRTPRR